MRAARIVAILAASLFLISQKLGAADRVKVIDVPDGGIQPQAAVDARGIVHLIYFKGDPKGGDIFYVRREPGREEFSSPIPVSHQPGTAMALGTIRGAQLAAGKNGRVHVVWDGMGEGVAVKLGMEKEKHPLFYTRLNDAGVAFEPERNLITYAYGLDGGSSVAADLQGNVCLTWHAPQPGNTNGEAGRAVFVARSSDEGKSFAREIPALSKATGACACCGMKAFADSRGDMLAFYRSAYQMTNRDETLLLSRSGGAQFEIAYTHHWSVGTCPMSSSFLSESSGEILAASETHGRVFFVRLDLATGKVSKPVSPDAKAKHPVAIGNSRGEVLLVWAEDTSWGKGGAIAWQLYDRDGQPISKRGREEGLKAWSLPTAFVDPDGTFTVIRG
jgi:hypothetical protein